MASLYSSRMYPIAGLEGKFQAHKIFERQGFEEFGIEGVENHPSIILTDVEHQKITNELAAAWKEAKKRKPKLELPDLWEIYKVVYKDKPHWLEAIKHYFPGQH